MRLPRYTTGVAGKILQKRIATFRKFQLENPVFKNHKNEFWQNKKTLANTKNYATAKISCNTVVNNLQYTPYSKTAAASDDLGRVARERDIEGHDSMFTCGSIVRNMPQNCCVPGCKKKSLQRGWR